MYVYLLYHRGRYAIKSCCDFPQRRASCYYYYITIYTINIIILYNIIGARRQTDRDTRFTNNTVPYLRTTKYFNKSQYPNIPRLYTIKTNK